MTPGIELDVYPTAASTTTNNTGINCEVGTSVSNSTNDAKGIYVYAHSGSGVNYGVEAAAGTVPSIFAASNIGGKFEATEVLLIRTGCMQQPQQVAVPVQPYVLGQLGFSMAILQIMQHFILQILI